MGGLLYFFIGLIYENYSSICNNINLALLPLFIVDLVVRYLKVRNLKRFLTHHWIDILIAIPYFRFIRLFRFLRLLKLTRVTKTGGAGGKLERTRKFFQAYRKLRRIIKSKNKRS